MQEPQPKAVASGINVWCDHTKLVSISDLKKHPKNPNKHPSKQIDLLAKIIKDQGWRAPITVSTRSGFITKGHGRLEAAVKLDAVEVPVDFQHYPSEAMEMADVVADNRIKELSDMDEDILKSIMKDVDGLVDMDILGYNEKERREILDDAGNEPVRDSNIDPDLAEEYQKKWKVKKKDLWTLGIHRIACGDCTDSELISRLMDGHKAQICWTDPPWNVAYGATKHPSWKKRSIENDNLGEDFEKFAESFCGAIKDNLDPGSPIYMAMSAQEWPVIDGVLRKTGFHWSSTIIWAKDRLVLSRKDYHTQYEPIWYGWLDGKARLRGVKDRTQSDLWNIPRPSKSDEHPTMKPVELVVRSLANSSLPKDIVFEPFSGSGTTLIACENTGRFCRAIEIDPKYVAVALERWSVLTGENPQKI